SRAAPCAVGAINDIAIHPSRNHLALAAGSQGAVVAWDLRHLHHPLLLFGSSAALPASPSPSARGAEWAQGDVWEVQFDPLTHLSLLSSARPAAATTAGAAAVPPMLACCDDGLLSLLHAGGAVQDIMHAPHAINSFDVEPSFGQVCSTTLHRHPPTPSTPSTPSMRCSLHARTPTHPLSCLCAHHHCIHCLASHSPIPAPITPLTCMGVCWASRMLTF
ncbi:unnamed protein product, partial [Closterium sp. Naga37s-1]